METISRFLLLLLFILIQVTILPFNFAFAGLIASVLLIKEFRFTNWLWLAAFLLALFGNINFGVVLIVFSGTMLILFLLKSIIPENTISKTLLILVSLPLVNLGILLVASILK